MAHPVRYDADDPVLARLAELCLALPQVEQRDSHGRPTWRCGPLFAVYGGGVKIAPGEHEPHPQGLLVKIDPVELPALEADDRFWVPAYYGPSGWRGVDLSLDPGLEGAGGVGWDEVAELLDASYRLGAPRRAVAELDARGGERR